MKKVIALYLLLLGNAACAMEAGCKQNQKTNQINAWQNCLQKKNKSVAGLAEVSCPGVVSFFSAELVKYKTLEIYNTYYTLPLWYFFDGRGIRLPKEAYSVKFCPAELIEVDSKFFLAKAYWAVTLTDGEQICCDTQGNMSQTMSFKKGLR